MNDNRPEFTLRAQGTGGYSFSTKETVRVGETLYTSVAVKVKILSVFFLNFKIQNLNVFKQFVSGFIGVIPAQRHGHRKGGIGDLGTFRSCWTPLLSTASVGDF